MRWSYFAHRHKLTESLPAKVLTPFITMPQLRINTIINSEKLIKLHKIHIGLAKV